MFFKQFRNTLVISFFTVLIINMSASLSLAATVVYLEPKEKNVLPDQDFAVDVFIKDVSNFAGYQFGINYDPALFSASSVNKGDFLSSSGSPYPTFFSSNTIDNINGKINPIFEVILGHYNVSGSGLLATVNFKSLAASGTGDIYLPLSLTKLSDRDGIAIPFTIENSAHVSVTPEPISCVLFVMGGAALASRRLLRKRS